MDNVKGKGRFFSTLFLTLCVFDDHSEAPIGTWITLVHGQGPASFEFRSADKSPPKSGTFNLIDRNRFASGEKAFASGVVPQRETHPYKRQNAMKTVPEIPESNNNLLPWETEELKFPLLNPYNPLLYLTNGSMRSNFPTYVETEKILQFLMKLVGPVYMSQHQIGTTYENRPLMAYRVGGIERQTRVAYDVVEGGGGSAEPYLVDQIRKSNLLNNGGLIETGIDYVIGLATGNVNHMLNLPTSPAIRVEPSFLKSLDLSSTSEVLMSAVHHAQELASLGALIYTLSTLLLEFGVGELEAALGHDVKQHLTEKNPSIRALSAGAAQMRYIMHKREMWFIPYVNVDGYIDVHALQNYDLRKNRRPTCGTGDQTDGVDLNRNYDNHFASTHDKCDELEYEGTHAFSEPETQAVKNLVEQYQTHSMKDVSLTNSFRSAINLHSYGGFWTHPFNCCKNEEPPPMIAGFFKELKLVLETDEAQYGPAWKSMKYTTTGESDDWLVATHSVCSLSPELGPESDRFSPEPAIMRGVYQENHYRFLTTFLKSGVQISSHAWSYSHPDKIWLASTDQSMPDPSRHESIIGLWRGAVSPTRLYAIRIRNSGLTNLGGDFDVFVSGAAYPRYSGTDTKAIVSSYEEYLENPYTSPVSSGLFAGSRLKLTSETDPFHHRKHRDDNLLRISDKQHVGPPTDLDMLKKAKFISSEGVEHDLSFHSPDKIWDRTLNRARPVGPSGILISFTTGVEAGKHVDIHALVPLASDPDVPDTLLDTMPFCVLEKVATLSPPFACHCGALKLENDKWVTAPTFIEGVANSPLCSEAIAAAGKKYEEQFRRSELLGLIGEKNNPALLDGLLVIEIVLLALLCISLLCKQRCAALLSKIHAKCTLTICKYLELMCCCLQMGCLCRILNRFGLFKGHHANSGVPVILLGEPDDDSDISTDSESYKPSHVIGKPIVD